LRFRLFCPDIGRRAISARVICVEPAEGTGDGFRAIFGGNGCAQAFLIGGGATCGRLLVDACKIGVVDEIVGMFRENVVEGDWLT